MYVVEAGLGGDGTCQVVAAGEYCYGETGAITRVETDGTQHRIVTGLPSIAPKGLGGIFANGPSDIKVASDGTVYVTIGMSSPADKRDVYGPKASMMSTLNTLESNNTLTQVADFAAFELAHNPDKGQGTVDSNDTDAHSILIDGNSVFVTDAGGNGLLRVNRSTGKVSLVAAFANRLVNAPPFAGGAAKFPIDAVPTAVVRDPSSPGQPTGVLRGRSADIRIQSARRASTASSPARSRGSHGEQPGNDRRDTGAVRRACRRLAGSVDPRLPERLQGRDRNHGSL